MSQRSAVGRSGVTDFVAAKIRWSADVVVPVLPPLSCAFLRRVALRTFGRFFHVRCCGPGLPANHGIVCEDPDWVALLADVAKVQTAGAAAARRQQQQQQQQQ